MTVTGSSHNPDRHPYCDTFYRATVKFHFKTLNLPWEIRNFVFQIHHKQYMATTISPIDESSFTDAPAFDAEELLNNSRPATESPREATYKPVIDAQQPHPDTPRISAGQQPQEPQPAMETAADSQPASGARRDTAFRRFIRLLGDSRTMRFVGLVMVVIACYAFIVAVSFFAHIGTDQSAVTSGDLDPEMIGNTGGPFGAWLSDKLINEWLGIGSFLLIIWTALSGLSLLKVYKADFWGMTLRCLLSALALSVILGFITYGISSPIYWGGMHGHILNEKLYILTGFWGALGISLIMGGMVVFLYLTELSKGVRYLHTCVSGAMARNAERRARHREEARIKREEEDRRRMEEELMNSSSATQTATTTTYNKSDSTTTPVPAAAPVVTAETAVDSQAVPSKPIVSTVPAIAEEITPEPEAPACDPADKTADITDKNDDENEETPLFRPAAKHKEDCHEEITESLFSTDKREREDEKIADEPTAPLFAKSAPSRVEEALAQPDYDPRAELSNYKFPSIELLRSFENDSPVVDAAEMEEKKQSITRTLNNYGIAIRRIEATVGPTVTLYEIIPAEGVRIVKIKRLEDDIALSLSALGIRIIAPIPGKGTIGIEVPNKDPRTVSMRSIIASEKYQNTTMDLPMALGRTISNEVFIDDLCKMPHLLVAGATGMGKSVGLNAIIASLLYKKHPSELKFVLVDPKMVEFSLYSKLERHYLAKLPDEEDAIITDPSKVVATLNSLCVEMDNRYALLKDASLRNIKEYNESFRHHRLNPAKGHRYLPYIVVIVDEFADLIMTAGKEVETPIARIAQKARAVGMHMILATQRPSTNVITGIIKANFPGRIAFRVFQMVDSRTILDRPGANQLIGRGDMLFSNNGKVSRVQCAFIDTPEVNAICDAIDCQVGYDHAYELPEYIPESDGQGALASLGDRDPLFDECARLVVTTDTASTSSLQRRYSIGYNRAGKIMDQMEAAGIVGPSQGGKPRQVLVDPMTLERMLENN